MDLQGEFKAVEDLLFPTLKLNAWERALYYHLLRHTRLQGENSAVFGLDALAKAAGMSVTTIREGVRSMHKKGCIRIEDRGNSGHRISVLLPSEIDSLRKEQETQAPLDLETVDFYTDRKYVGALVAREEDHCFYCLKGISAEQCVLDHVEPQVDGGGNSYRNIVASCHECNSLKRGASGTDFLRTLYRRSVLTQDELAKRLKQVERLRAGECRPHI
jgi:hypothetical protein